MSSRLDYSAPTTQFAFDVNSSQLFKKDDQNYINIVSANQLNTLTNYSILDIFLSTNNVIEPHYHQTASELVYCISGAATISLLNPFTKELISYAITPGQVVNIPKAWWHFEIATEDQTHLLAIFDAPVPDTILGSDILKFTPANIMAHTYCMNEQQWAQLISSIQPDTFIGPSKNCDS